MKKFILTFLFIISIASTVYAQWIREVVHEPIGIKAAGMGGAFTAVADDASALYYNPAGLAEPGGQYQSGMMDTSRAEKDLLHYYVLEMGPFVYGEKRVISLQNYRAQIYHYGFSQRGNNGINWGLIYKRVHEQSPENSSAQGWATDVGLLFKMTPKVNAGFLAQNIGAGNIDLLPNYRFGTAAEYLGLLWCADADYRDVSTYHSPMAEMHYGLEKEVVRGFALRVGSDNKIGTVGFSVGLGFATLDYATWATLPQTFRFGFKFGQDKFKEGKERDFVIFKEKEYVEIKVDGSLVGGRDEFSLFSGIKKGADTIREDIVNAGKDKDIEGILLKVGNINNQISMFSAVQELREELIRFKKSGKKVVAYIEADADFSTYYLVSVADKIIMPPGGGVGLFGIAMSPYFMGQLFENIGIKWNILTAGKYKASFSSYNKGVTLDARLQMEEYLNDVHMQVWEEILKVRNLEAFVIGELKQGKFLTAKKAKEYKLIDATGYYEDAKNMLKDVSGSDLEPNIISVEQLSQIKGPFDFSYVWPWPNKIAIIDIDGVIVLGESSEDMVFGSKTIGADDICEEIEKAVDNPTVRAIILRINSPGGSAIAADQIYDKLEKVKDDTDVVIIASLGNVAASGGYYIACAADKIVANTTTLAGSIGVIAAFPVYYSLLDKIDVKTETLKTSDSVDMLSGLREITKQEEEMLQEAINDTHERFILAVAKGRKMKIEEVKPHAEGHIFSGKKAQELGLVDELGNFTSALQVAKKEAGIEGDVQMVRFVRLRNFWQQIGYRVGSVLGLDKTVSLYMKPQLMQYRFVY